MTDFRDVWNVPATKAEEQRTPKTRALLLRLLDPAAAKGETPVDTLNLKTAFAFAVFMRIGEFTDLAVEVECDDFVHTKLTTRCLTISPDGDHLQLFLPRSKADKDNLGVSISMTATGDLACPVRNASCFSAPARLRGQPILCLNSIWAALPCFSHATCK